MSEAATLHREPAESPLTPESWGKLGMWIFLCGDAMTFGTLIVTFGIMRIAAADWPVPSEVLGINLTAAMTFLLICSSVTMVLSLSGIKRGNMQEFRQVHAAHDPRRRPVPGVAGLRVDPPHP